MRFFRIYELSFATLDLGFVLSLQFVLKMCVLPPHGSSKQHLLAQLTWLQTGHVSLHLVDGITEGLSKGQDMPKVCKKCAIGLGTFFTDFWLVRACLVYI